MILESVAALIGKQLSFSGHWDCPKKKPKQKKPQTSMTQTQPKNFASTLSLPPSLPPPSERMRSHQGGSGGDGQMSTMIRPLLDICPDRIRLNQTLVHARACVWVGVSHDAKD